MKNVILLSLSLFFVSFGYKDYWIQKSCYTLYPKQTVFADANVLNYKDKSVIFWATFCINHNGVEVAPHIPTETFCLNELDFISVVSEIK